MSQRISSPEYLLQRLDKVAQQVATFQQLTTDLARIKQHFEGLQQIYDRIQADIETIERSWADTSEKQSEVVGELHQRLGEATSEIARLREAYEKLDALRADTLDTIRRSSTDLEIRLVARHHAWVEDQRAWRLRYEQEQFQKLDNVLQSYRLIDTRQREAEADFTRKIEALEQRISADVNSLKTQLAEMQSAMTDQSAKLEQRLRRMFFAGAASLTLTLTALILALVVLLR